MQRMKFGQQNPVKAARKPYGFSGILAATIVPVYILATIVSSYAEDPSAAIIVGFRGNGLNLRRGTNRNVTPVKAAGQRLQNSNDVLYIDGDGRSRAMFAFAVGQIWEYGGLRVQTNPSDKSSEYRFPCRGRGNFTISWRPLGETQDRACLPGIALGRRRRNLNSQLPLSNPWNIVQAAKNIFKAQTEDDEEVVVVPSQGRTIIETNDTGNDVLVDVAEGNVLVKSDKNPAGKPVRAGERYSYLQDRVTPIDRNALLNSPSMQEFLNPNNWSSPDVPQRIADEIAKEVESDRTALGLSSPSVASSPRINNNQNRTPVRATPQVNISGEWILKTQAYNVSDTDNVTCIPVPNRELVIKPRLTQEGNEISADPMTLIVNEGTISGNSVYLKSEIFSLNGTVSSDGNQITGTFTCSSLSQPFTMTRQGSQSSAQNNYSSQYVGSGSETENNANQSRPLSQSSNVTSTQQVNWILEDYNFGVSRDGSCYFGESDSSVVVQNGNNFSSRFGSTTNYQSGRSNAYEVTLRGTIDENGQVNMSANFEKFIMSYQGRLEENGEIRGTVIGISSISSCRKSKNFVMRRQNTR